jgi:GNAT superfamily N-acetyltransferase
VSLPDGLLARPLARDDLDDTVAMVNACELRDSGELMVDRADLLADSRREGFDTGSDWVGVFDGDRIVAWAMIVQRGRAWADVHPDVRGRGIGTWLRRWTEDRARGLGSETVGQTIDDARTEVVGMLGRAGYTPRDTSWILHMDHPERPGAPLPPTGIDLRAFRQKDEDEVLAMFEKAFSEQEGRTPSPPATWLAMVTQREGFEPEDLVVALADDRIVGGAFLIDADEIWISQLAVDREFRHRGIARALLQTAFARSFDRGYSRTSLSTDSGSGALSLYERLGMTVRRSFTRHELDV